MHALGDMILMVLQGLTLYDCDLLYLLSKLGYPLYDVIEGLLVLVLISLANEVSLVDVLL